MRAVHAGLAIVEELEQLTQTKRIEKSLQVRVGIATGLVAVSTQDAISIAGTTPNLAARVQSAVKPGQVGVAPGSRRIAGEQFVYEDGGRFELKGFEGPVQISIVTAARSLASRSAWRVRGGATPMVGREAEMATLMACWVKVMGGTGAGVLMTGEAGVGKSRVAVALEQRVEHEAHSTIRLQCSPFHANTALHPFSQHLVEASGFRRHDTALAHLEKLEAQLAIARLVDDQDLRLLAALLDVDVSSRFPPLGLPPPLQLQMTKEVLTRYFAGIAQHASAAALAPAASNPGLPAGSGPLLLVFEDLHWVDPTSLEVIDLILANAHSARILLLMTARPEFKAPFDPARGVASVPLERLGLESARSIARNLATETTLPETAIEAIIAKTDGVPLYIEEMTRMVLDSRSEHPEGGESPDEIPDTLLDLLMERLDRLGDAKLLAQVGSVLGREFPRDLLFSVAEMEPAHFEASLRTMLASGLVLSADGAGTRYLFKHALVEDTAYASILLKSRAALHSRAADVLLREFRDSTERHPELVARHLSRARRQLEASRFWLAAGGQALGRGAPREAAAHLKEGVAVLVRRAGQRGALRFRAGASFRPRAHHDGPDGSGQPAVRSRAEAGI